MSKYPKKWLAQLRYGKTAELTEIKKDVFCCPVCGYPGVDLMHPITERGGEVWDFTICPSCGVEYGADDSVSPEMVRSGFGQVKKWAELRNKWLRNMEITPEVKAQLANIGVEL